MVGGGHGRGAWRTPSSCEFVVFGGLIGGGERKGFNIQMGLGPVDSF
jgi:hypothetical protein